MKTNDLAGRSLAAWVEYLFENKLVDDRVTYLMSKYSIWVHSSSVVSDYKWYYTTHTHLSTRRCTGFTKDEAVYRMALTVEYGPEIERFPPNYVEEKSCTE